ncbi:MAG: YbaB/EbfC family nucleoid-associated protein [bacterium]
MNMQKLLKQAQQMQQKFQSAQDELKDKEFTGQAGGGMVKVTVDGQGNVKALNIKPEVVDPDDVELLEDMIVSALRNAAEKASASMSDALGDMGLPTDAMGGLGNLLG